MVVTNKDQVSITEISHGQKKCFFFFIYFSCYSESFSRQNSHEKSKPILPFNGKFNVDAENGVVI